MLFYAKSIPVYHVCCLYCSTDDAEVLFSDAESCGLMAEDFAWIVSERAFNAATTPIGKFHLVTLLVYLT